MRVRCPLAVRVALLVLMAVAISVGGVAAYLGPLPDTTLPEAGLTAPSGYVYDRNGRLLYEMVDESGGRQRSVPLDKMPLHLRQAVVATEDARFYRHPGVDILAIGRAAFSNLRAGQIVSGASTIPQQLARMLLLPSSERTELSLRRILREAVLAIGLNVRYSRDEILERYLNQTYFGAYAYGAEAAAQTYCAKPVAQLDLAECALLAGLIQSPEVYNPLTHPEAALERQQVVLRLMVENGYLTADQAEQAANEPLRLAGNDGTMLAPHAVVYARTELESLLTPEQIAAGGLRIYTTIDLPLQQQAERALQQHLARLNTPRANEPAHNVHNGAVVVLDVATGGIAVMVGSPDYADGAIDGAVNGALALRQPGSAVKPFTYAAAFERGYGPASVLYDVPSTFTTADGKSYTPINYDYRYHGPVSLRQALGSSYNVIAVELLDRIGVQALPDLAHRAGAPALADSEAHGLAMTLGSCEVPLLQLARGYATLARGGRYLDTHLITRVETTSGEVLYQRPEPRPIQTIDERVAYLVTDILADSDARLPAFGANSALETGLPAAVKTGTTTDWRDNWTVGYTTSRVVGVWVGNADGSRMESVSGVSGAAPVWQEVMLAAHPTAPAPFVRPAGLQAVRVCTLSGKLPTSACPHSHEELFLAEDVPTETCDEHQLVAVDAATGEPVTGECSAPACVRRATIIWPAEALDWAIEQGLARPEEAASLAAMTRSPSTTQVSETAPLRIVQPADNARYRLSEALPRSAQAIGVQVAAATLPVGSEVSLLLDDRIIATWQQSPYSALWPLEEGEHTLLARASLADGRLIESARVHIWVDQASGGN
ncbi:MAG: penicillin-binding protein 1C [Anaerolineales bacterium]